MEPDTCHIGVAQDPTGAQSDNQREPPPWPSGFLAAVVVGGLTILALMLVGFS